MVCQHCRVVEATCLYGLCQECYYTPEIHRAYRLHQLRNGLIISFLSNSSKRIDEADPVVKPDDYDPKITQEDLSRFESEGGRTGPEDEKTENDQNKLYYRIGPDMIGMLGQGMEIPVYEIPMRRFKLSDQDKLHERRHIGMDMANGKSFTSVVVVDQTKSEKRREDV